MGLPALVSGVVLLVLPMAWNWFFHTPRAAQLGLLGERVELGGGRGKEIM